LNSCTLCVCLRVVLIDHVTIIVIKSKYSAMLFGLAESESDLVWFGE